MNRTDERSERTVLAMWPAQNLAERVIGGMVDCTMSMVDRADTWTRQATLERELFQLDDGTLADLGLARDDIPAVAHAYTDARLSHALKRECVR